MTNPWLPRLGGFFVLLLVAAGLILLQVSEAGNRLLFHFPPYCLIAIAALIAFALPQSRPGGDSLSLCATAVFCGYVLIRALTSPAPYWARTDLYSMLAALTVYGLTVTILSSSTRRIALIVALLVFAVCHVLMGFVQSGLGENFVIAPALEKLEISKRARGLYGNPDHLAGLLELLGIFGLSIACWSRWPRWAKVLVGYLAVVSYVGVALTASRGGYLSVASSLILFAALSAIALRAGGRSLLRKYGAIGVIALAAAFIAPGLLIQQNASLGERLENLVVPDQTRLDLWRASIQQWKLQPLIGTGSGTYRFYGRQFRTERTQVDPVMVHNDYLHLLCEYGAIGALGFLLFFVAHLRNGWRNFLHLGPDRLGAGRLLFSNRLALNIGALCAIGAYAVHSMVDFNLHIPANALLVAFAFGILANPGPSPGSEPEQATVSLIPKLSIALLGAVLLFQCVRLLPGEYYAEHARVALQDEKPADAVSLANKALTYEQKNPNVFFYLGRALGALGNDQRERDQRIAYYEKALGAFDGARLLVPLDGSYPLDMAFVYDEMGRFAEAEWMYGLARSRDPRSYAMSQLYKSHLQIWQNEGRTRDNGKPGVADPARD